jgi:hypothetical protein
VIAVVACPPSVGCRVSCTPERRWLKLSITWPARTACLLVDTPLPPVGGMRSGVMAAEPPLPESFGKRPQPTIVVPAVIRASALHQFRTLVIQEVPPNEVFSAGSAWSTQKMGIGRQLQHHWMCCPSPSAKLRTDLAGNSENGSSLQGQLIYSEKTPPADCEEDCEKKRHS